MVEEQTRKLHIVQIPYLTTTFRDQSLLHFTT